MNIHSLWALIFRFTRQKRMKKVFDVYQISRETVILDVGGTETNWLIAPAIPRVILLNIEPRRALPNGISQVLGDGCLLPFKDNSVDVVFSNSTIEHVGVFDRQRQFAEEIRRVGARHYVQTPNRNFLIEPHYMTPFFQFLSHQRRTRWARHFSLWGLITKPSPKRSEEFSEGINLLTSTQLEELFPDGELAKEKVLGMTKSIEIRG